MMQFQRTFAQIQRYYGEVLGSSGDLKTSACCTSAVPAPHIARALDNVPDEIKARFYGCGSPIPPALWGAHVLDLGCGSGRDCYVLSQLVGPLGHVIGVDMTEAQLAIARHHLDGHAARCGLGNVEFRAGYIEDLLDLGIADGSMDLVVSNCVLNLSPDKARVFSEIFRVLKPGGEIYIADVFADRRVPPEIADDPVLRGECLGGALYWEDFRRLMAQAGCADIRVCQARPLEIHNPDLANKLGSVGFSARTFRAFRLNLEDRCEDYGQAVRYKGSIAELPHGFDLDDHHYFATGKIVAVCGNTADMLSQSRYAPHFDVFGAKTLHYGIFDCAPSPAAASRDDMPVPCC
ncbi:MAG: methyltransferase domain-containing protein [Rhizomicrobium sp.]